MRIEADWLHRPGLRRLLRALDGQAFFVGGCVRNTLLGEPVTDVDLATPLPPGEVMHRLEAAGIKVVPTGLEHGTVTAVVDGTGYEITTFRADVETFGRHARVAFTTSLEQDARRRDFTINALYATPDGEIIDPVGGLADLAARRVRFIGDPRQRIREDYLRILRFFRFTAWYGREIDPEGLAACAELVDGIERLARERIGAEMRKLLAAPDPSGVLAAMEATGILARVLPGASARLVPALVAAERRAGVGSDRGMAPDWIARLAALTEGLEVEEVAERLRLSRAEARLLERVRALARRRLPPAVAAHEAGPRAATAAALLRAARGEEVRLETLAAEVKRGAQARFPLRARDLMALGIPPGPELGRTLESARARWVASDFALDREALLAEIDDRGRDRGHASGHGR